MSRPVIGWPCAPRPHDGAGRTTTLWTDLWSRRWESNPRPDDYKSSALPTAPHRPRYRICRRRPAILRSFPPLSSVLRTTSEVVPVSVPFRNACFCIPGLAGCTQWPTLPSTTDSQSGGRGGRDGGFPAFRALIVLVLFVAATVLILGRSSIRRHRESSTRPLRPHRHDHHTKPPCTRRVPPRPPSPRQGLVMVANGSEVNGAAAAVTTRAAGRGMGPAYRRPMPPHGHRHPDLLRSRLQKSAEAIATSLQLPITVVAPTPRPPPITSIGTALVRWWSVRIWPTRPPPPPRPPPADRHHRWPGRSDRRDADPPADAAGAWPHCWYDPAPLPS